MSHTIGLGALDNADAATTPIPTFGFAIQNWKQAAFEAYFPERAFTFLPFELSESEIRRTWLPAILSTPGSEVFVWSREIPETVLCELRAHNVAVTLIEDGFLRSTQAHASRTPPISLALDCQTPYFDARSPSDLEDLLHAYDFEADEELMERARRAMRMLLDKRLSKYNTRHRVVSPALSAKKVRRRVLVVGQVEGDASIRFGCSEKLNNNDLVRLASKENPDADIFYKPHPDVLNRVRPAQSNPRDVAGLCTIIAEPISLADALETIDRVYTITSLAGFEALLRGIEVTTVGCPFYSGWGLTDDRQPNPRRHRQLGVEAVFAAAYLLYPRYFDIRTGKQQTFEQALAQLEEQLATDADDPQNAFHDVPERPKWAPFGAYGILGWRHLLPYIVAPLVTRVGNRLDAIAYRQDPIVFFRELTDPRFRFVGRLLYPFDDTKRTVHKQRVSKPPAVQTDDPFQKSHQVHEGRAKQEIHHQ